MFVAALAVLDFERNAREASITTFGDALWWAFVTITTVGYGDYSPVTVEGRLVAVGLMLGGIALIGLVTASLASWIVERVAAETTIHAEAVEETAPPQASEHVSLAEADARQPYRPRRSPARSRPLRGRRAAIPRRR